MEKQKETYNIENQFELLISKILISGVFLSGFLMFCGIILLLWNNSPDQISDLTLKFMFNELLNSSPIGILFTGILVLLLTPVIRVIISIYLYIRIADFRFVVITIFVLFFIVLGIIFNFE